jgi:glycosyltransferase involved in cell wall biosynthesis
MTKYYSNSDMVITVTESLAHSLSLRGVRKDITIVTNGADCTIFKPYDKSNSRSKMGFNEDDFILVYSGSIGVYYRLDVVIAAIKKVIIQVHNIKLIIVGFGNGLEEVLNLIKETHLQDSVFYLGTKMDKMELAEILSASDVGIVPYDANPLWKNALPVKSFEYFACGLPVIATTYKDSLLGKLIYENKIGMISDPENVNTLADIIEKMYKDSAFRTVASKRAVSLVEERFDRKKIVEKFHSLLLKCIN